MIKVAATSTDERRKKIMDMLNQISHNQSPTLQHFGITVGNNFANAPARILDAPSLEYGNGKTVRPAKGQWRIDNLQFWQVNPKQQKYAILILDKYANDNSVRDFCNAVSIFLVM